MVSNAPQYPRIYHVSWLIRILILIVAVPCGYGGIAAIAYSGSATDVQGGIKLGFFLLVLSSMAILYAFRRRVILYEDSFEATRLFRTKKYYRKDIQGITLAGVISFKDTEKTIVKPGDIHPDHFYDQWFRSLPYIRTDADDRIEKLFGELEKRDDSAALQTARETFNASRGNSDVIESISQSSGIQKWQAGLLLLLFLLLLIVVAVIVMGMFPHLPIYLMKDVGGAVAIVFVGIVAGVVQIVKWIKGKK